MFILVYAQMDLVILECLKTIFIVANNFYAVQTSTRDVHGKRIFILEYISLRS